MGAYLHFPFCRSVCDYCGYETRLISKSGATQFSTLAEREILGFREADDFSRATLTSMFFGGGTASLLPLPAMESTLRALKDATGTDTIEEVTLECEPGTISVGKLEHARALGVNRVSICAQSFDNAELARLTRKHSSADALQLLDATIEAGIENRHVDLMYGFRDQTLDDWRRTVEFTASLPIHHISAYKLYVFRYGRLHRANLVPRPESEAEAATDRLSAMHDIARTTFAAAGFEQYTLTEYARPGYQSRYLNDTFGGGDILPLGPSSFGRCGHEVWQNPGLVNMYQDAAGWESGRRAYRLTPAEAFKRDVILGLWRLRVDTQERAGAAGVTASDALLAALELASREDKLDWDGRVVDLRPHQRFGVGDVMSALAALDADLWIEPDGSRAGTRTMRPAWDSNPLSSELRTVLRMARRDPKFYIELSLDPRDRIGMLDPPLQEADVRALVDAIGGTGPAAPATLLARLREEWESIVSEQRRDTRRAAEV
ncbi:radical SAM protein [Solirubrobacter phytolaccae]|uniref:Heme chaperone HemW n=1 Tax=Solirubrobacter phytolaccae TaxID=1404360 RepID=A0A9X3NPP3_9ACTN|nr:radical SAM protein [Solirubrobacter phytolaccae]MDA0185262.1 radical SAM protein [Solirubrobacter phytolaccae]